MRKKKRLPKKSYNKTLSVPIMWVNRIVKWWSAIADGWDKISSGTVRITVCIVVLGVAFSPDATVGTLIKYGPILQPYLTA